MSQWQLIRSMPDGDTLHKIQLLFNDSFPIELRHFFAEDIEKQNWLLIDPDNNDFENSANEMLNFLLSCIERHCQSLVGQGDLVTEVHFRNIGKKLVEMYQGKALGGGVGVKGFCFWEE